MERTDHEIHVPCFRCGYDLYGIRATCPECGMDSARSFLADRLVLWHSLPLWLLGVSLACQLTVTTLAVMHVFLRGIGISDRIGAVVQNGISGLATASLLLLSSAGWLGCSQRIVRTVILVGLVTAVALRSPGWGYSPQLTVGQLSIRLQLTQPDPIFAAVYAITAILVFAHAPSRFTVGALGASGLISVLAAFPADPSSRLILLMAAPVFAAFAAALSTAVVVRVLSERHRIQRNRLSAHA